MKNLDLLNADGLDDSICNSEYESEYNFLGKIYNNTDEKQKYPNNNSYANRLKLKLSLGVPYIGKGGIRY